MPRDVEENVYEDSIEFLLKLIERNGHNPEHHQAQGLLTRIHAEKARRNGEEEPNAQEGTNAPADG
jgi:hypothetical protein